MDLLFIFLFLQGAKFEDKQNLEIFIPKNDSVSNRAHFLLISQQLSGFSTNVRESDSTSDEEEDSSKADPIEAADNEIDLINKIKRLTFDNRQLFFNLVSTLLGLIQNDSMPKEEDGLISYTEKCFAYLLSNDLNLMCYHQFGLSSILFSLVFELSSHKDGPAKIIPATIYSNYQAFIQRCIDNGNKQNLLLGLDSMKHLLSCMSQSAALLSNPSTHNTEIFQIFSKFTQFNFFELLKSMLASIDGLDDNPKQYFQYLDSISKSLVKINKKLKNSRNFCNGVSNKGQIQQRTPALRDNKHGRKHLSSDEEGQQKLIMKKLPDSCEDEDESAENVSDFDNFFFDNSTDSEMEVKKEKSSSSSKQKPVELPTLNKKGIFVLTFSKFLRSCFVLPIFRKISACNLLTLL